MSCVAGYYGGYNFDPVPLIGISRSYTRQGNEDKLLEEMTISMDGYLIPNMGVNAPSGDGTRISKLRIMQDELMDVLSTDRQNLYIVDTSGFPIINEYPRVDSVNFDEDVLVQKSHYTISFVTTDEEQNDYIESSSDSWDTIINENETRSVTHTVSAKGIRGDYGGKSGSTPVLNAKNFVLTKIGSNPALQQYFISVSGYSGYNHSKQETIDELAGTYSIIETWTLHNDTYTDDRTTETSTTIDSNGDEIVTLSITGTVVGLNTSDEPTPAQRLAAAELAFENIIKAEIGYDSSNVTSKSKTSNAFSGTITYSVATISDDSDVIVEKSIERSFSRNDDGSTVQTVTTSASVLPQSSGVIQDVIDYVVANVFDIASVNPPYSTGDGVQISRASTRNEINKTYSQTNTYHDVGGATYREEYTINGTTDAEGLLTVTVNGSVYGLEDESTTSSESRFSLAEAGFSTVQGLAQARAQSLATDVSRTLATGIVSDAIGYNEKTGVITYSFVYNDKIEPPEGIKNQSIEISDSGGDPVVATIAVPGRAAGPVFQIMNTIIPFIRSVNLDWTLEKTTSESTADGLALTTLQTYEPTILNDDVKPVQSKSYNPITRKYRRTVTWTYNATGTTFRLNLLGEL